MDREIGMGRETETRSIEELLATRDDQIDGMLRVVYVVCNKMYTWRSWFPESEMRSSSSSAVNWFCVRTTGLHCAILLWIFSPS